MKKSLISFLAIIGILLGSITVFAKEFPDLSNTHPNFVAINYLSNEGVLNGYDDGTFQPERLVNRAEALKIIFESMEVEMDDGLDKEGLFSDVPADAWYAGYVAYGKNEGIINGNPDGTYAPARTVARAEFMKMLLNSIGFKKEQWENQKIFNDVPENEWFTPFMNYAGQAGLISPDDNQNLLPGKEMKRGEVSEVLYLLIVILNGDQTQFLITQSESQMAQIEIYIANNDIVNAKRASELAVDMTQQAYKNMSEDNVVLGAAKIARAYDYLVNSYISALRGEFAEAEDWANQTIDKATEAWEANNETQPIARHIKDRAREILDQIQA